MPRTIGVAVRRPDLRRAIADRLARAGAVVEECDLATHAYNLAHGGGVDLLVLDLHLADAHGDEVCRDLKSLDETVGLPIIMLIEEEDPWMRQRCEAAGAESVLTYEAIDRVASVAGELLRTEARVQIPGQAEYYVVGASKRSIERAAIEDVSLTGAALLADTCNVEKGFTLDVRITVAAEEPFLVRAEVVRVSHGARGYTIHLAWQAFRAGDRERFDQLIRRQRRARRG
jgi:CheY-like chemotaxis protein